METHVLTMPVTPATITGYTLRYLLLLWEDGVVEVCVVSNTGATIIHRYHAGSAPTGIALMTGLNKADLPAKSLHRRILERLAADGVIGNGTISGEPD